MHRTMPVMNKNRKFESVVQSWKESNGDSTIGIGGKKSGIDLKYWLQRGNQSMADVNLLHDDQNRGTLEIEQPSHHSYSSSSTSERGKSNRSKPSSASIYGEHGQASYNKTTTTRRLSRERRRGSRQSYHYMPLSSPKNEQRSHNSSSSSTSTEDDDSSVVTPRTNILNLFNSTSSHEHKLPKPRRSGIETSRRLDSLSTSTDDDDFYFATPKTNILSQFSSASSHENKPPKPRRSGIERSRRSNSSSAYTRDEDSYFITPRTNVSHPFNPRNSRHNEASQQVAISPTLIVPNLQNTKLEDRTLNRTRTHHREYNCKMPLLSFKNKKNDTRIKPRPAKKREWKSCVDPKSGRTYYYDVRTRETQWAKPVELATQSERRKIEDKEAKQKEFFRSMESNILKAFNSGVVPGKKEVEEDEFKDLPKRANLIRGTKKPKLVRTISSMDDNVLAELAQNEDMNFDGAKGGIDMDIVMGTNSGSGMDLVSPDSTTTSFFDSLPQPEVHHPLKKDSPPSVTSYHALQPLSLTAPARVTPPQDKHAKALRKPALGKRNTCGTLYISNTMSDPDVEGTIKCVCGVYRTHIVQSIKENSYGAKFDDYEVFNDDYNEAKAGRGTHLVESEMCIEMMRIDGEESEIPTLDEITDFYRFIFKKAQMENDCIVISLIYVERLMRETNGGVRPNMKNWRSVLFSAMILSSKVWDDLSMWNADFTLACPEGVSFSLQRINQLEIALLNCFKYNVKVPASEYAKYYFLIRSLLIRSGLAGQDIIHSKKLDAEGAEKLEFRSSNYKNKKPSIIRRSQSDAPDRKSGSPRSGHISLEQVVRM